VKNRMPFWQTTPCPPWCMGGHEDTDHPEDRFHRPGPDILNITLTVNDPVVHAKADGKYYRTPVELRVDVEQHYRETEPRVLLCEDYTFRPHYDLTADEAEEIGHALIEAAKVARGEASEALGGAA
jgi:hypothetical protein